MDGRRRAAAPVRLIVRYRGETLEERHSDLKYGAGRFAANAAWLAMGGPLDSAERARRLTLRTPDCIVRPGELNRMLYYGDNWESNI